MICGGLGLVQSLFQSLRSHCMGSIADESETLFREYCNFQEKKRTEKLHIPTHSIAHSLVVGMAIGAQLIASLKSLVEFSKCQSVGTYLICCQAIQVGIRESPKEANLSGDCYFEWHHLLNVYMYIEIDCILLVETLQEFLDTFNNACWAQKMKQRILPVKVTAAEPLDCPFL